MTKHRKHRTKRKSQRGGGVFDYFGVGSSTETGVEQPSMMSNFSDKLSGAVSSTEGYLKGAKDKSNSWFSGISNPFSSSSPSTSTSTYSPPAEPTMEYNPEQPAVGGKRRRKSRKSRKSRKMRGGKGDLGLTYYATDVSNDGLKVVEPTYWIKGGSKRRKTRRHKKR